MSSKQNKNFEIVQYNFEVFCFCNDNLLYFILFLFFLYFQSIFKKLSARCTSQFVGLWPGWGCRSELWQSNSRKIYCKVGYADRENDFFDTFQNVFEKGFLQGERHNLREIWPEWRCCNVLRHTQLRVKYTAKWGGWIEKWFSNTSQSSFRIILLFFQLCVVLFYLYTIFLF